MLMSNVLFLVAGLFIGVALKGGMFLFLIPAAGIAVALGYINLPRVPGSKTASIPVVTRAMRATGLAPAVTPELRNAIKDESTEFNEPNSTLKVNQVWARANADVNKAMTDLLQGLRRVIPNVHSLVIFSSLNTYKEWGIRVYSADPSTQIASDVKVTETSGLIGQLFNMDVERLLEGDLSGGKSLLYYIDNPMIKSTVQALTHIASALYALYYKSFISAKNFIGQHQFSILYSYQHKFFQTMSVKDIYNQIFDYVKQNIPYDRMMLLALDKQDQVDTHKEREGRVVCADGIDSEQFKDKKFTLSDKGLAVFAIFQNHPVERIFSSNSSQYIPRIDNRETRNMDFRQLFVMPVSTDNNASQAELAICLESRTSGRYTEHEMQLLKAFAGVAGFAYARASQYETKKDEAIRDGMTGLLNKRTLPEALRTEKIRADRRKYNIGVLMMDIDHFKSVNDTYGHGVGDMVIIEIAKTLLKEVRKDIDIVARYGGEELVVGLVDTTPEGMIETAERIRKAVLQLEFEVHQASPLRVSISIGAYLVTPEFNDNMMKAVNFADQALYKAKEGGRNQVVQYTETV